MSNQGDPSRQTLESIETGEVVSPASLESPGRRATRIGERFAGQPLPQRIGRYEVIARIGVGGMGEVFSARDPELDREVAIKLVHAELDDGSASSIRLLREAQTLAQVDHPNVVRIFEVGLHGTRVFLAMEVVRGSSLREHVKLGRPWRELVAVLAQAGRGLHAVHQAGLVHRDVKPDNVLVGDDGRVRVVDFGLARNSGLPTDPPHTDEATLSLRSPSVPLPSRLTASGAVVGTPVYMAPEQMRRPVIDARCDQFAFCVMAWEALAGVRPFPGHSIAELFAGHRRGARMPNASAVPPGIWRALQRGTAYDAEQRWDSVNALVLELERVAARRSWTRAVTIAAMATVGASALAWSLVADASRSCVDDGAASRDARIAEVVIDAQRHGIDPQALGGLHVRAYALAMAREQACLSRTELGTSPGSDHESTCLERSAHRLDDLVAALAQAPADVWDVEALRAIAALPDPQQCGTTIEDGYAEPPTAELAFRVERVRDELDDAWTELELGRARDIAGRSAGLLAMAEATGHPPLRAEAGWFAGELARQLGEPSRARAQLLEAAALAEESRHDALAADIWAALAELAIAQLGDTDEGRQWLRRAEVAAARLPADPTRARVLRLRAAQLARLSGDLEGARAQLEQLLADAPSVRVLDESWWPVLVVAADVAEAIGAFDEALALHERHRDSLVAALGSEHPEVAGAYYNLGKLSLARHDHERARAELDRARGIWLRTRGPDHLDLALVHAAMQSLETEVGSLAQARAHADEVLRIRGEMLPADHPDLALAWLGVGGAALLQGEHDDAVAAYEAALVVEEHALGADHPETALVRANAAEALLAAGHVTRARALAEAARDRLATATALDPSVLAFAERVYGAALRDGGELEPAERALERAATLLGPQGDPQEHAAVLLERARVELAGGHPADARASLALARTRLDTQTGDATQRLRDDADALARTL